MNGILEASGSRAEHCSLWPFSPTRQIAGALTAMMDARRGLDNVMGAVSGLKDGLWKTLANGLARVQEGPVDAPMRRGRRP